MSRYKGYIDGACWECDDYILPYGCVNSGCPIRQDYEQGMEEMAADFQHDKRKDERMEREYE